mmetsp:Transcript_24515/g.39327  ORF Transcript_24515/g.39327 Transcript_24515/m.39327 type:complete len:732 (+) Transcript_24515:770-2965(+)
MKKNKESFLQKILGHYQLNMGKESVNVMILESAFSERKIPILFGLNRSSFIKYNNDQTQTNNESTNQQGGKRIYIEKEYLSIIEMQISKDSEFLKSQAIVNYSLIIGGREHTMDDTKLVTLSSPKSNTKILRRKTPSQFSRSIPYSDHSPPNVRPILGSSKLKLPSSTLPTIPNSIPHNYHHRPRNSRRSARSRGNSPTEALHHRNNSSPNTLGAFAVQQLKSHSSRRQNSPDKSFQGFVRPGGYSSKSSISRHKPSIYGISKSSITRHRPSVYDASNSSILQSKSSVVTHRASLYSRHSPSIYANDTANDNSYPHRTMSHHADGKEKILHSPYSSGEGHNQMINNNITRVSSTLLGLPSLPHSPMQSPSVSILSTSKINPPPNSEIRSRVILRSRGERVDAVDGEDGVKSVFLSTHAILPSLVVPNDEDSPPVSPERNNKKHILRKNGSCQGNLNSTSSLAQCIHSVSHISTPSLVEQVTPPPSTSNLRVSDIIAESSIANLGIENSAGSTIEYGVKNRITEYFGEYHKKCTVDNNEEPVDSLKSPLPISFQALELQDAKSQKASQRSNVLPRKAKILKRLKGRSASVGSVGDIIGSGLQMRAGYGGKIISQSRSKTTSRSRSYGHNRTNSSSNITTSTVTRGSMVSSRSSLSRRNNNLHNDRRSLRVFSVSDNCDIELIVRIVDILDRGELNTLSSHGTDATVSDASEKYSVKFQKNFKKIIEKHVRSS